MQKDHKYTHESEMEHHAQEKCDRRLSRAARTLIINKTLPILQGYEGSSSKNLSFRDQMKIYEDTIKSLMTNADTCILNPARDIFWKEEFDHTTSKHSRQITSTLHKCGSCGKTFLSRFYLDLHMVKYHEDVTSEESKKSCPAKEMCKLLGEKLCERQALNAEPFYAPGIHSSQRRNWYNGHDHNSQQIMRTFQRKLHDQPCNTTALRESQQFCIESVNHCFTGKNHVIEDISRKLCETQTCHHHLYSLLGHADDLREQWHRHHNEMHEISFGLVLVCLTGLFGVTWHYSTTIRKILSGTKQRRKFDFQKRKSL